MGDAPPRRDSGGLRAAESRAPHAAAELPLRQRLAAAGRALGEREAAHRAALEAARARCEELRVLVAEAFEAFHGAASAAGAPHLRVEVGAPRLDDKHVRAVEFEVRRGRHVGIVTVKARGDVTLVGPFRTGKAEGPCRTFPMHAQPEIEAALGEFLACFVEEATAP